MIMPTLGFTCVLYTVLTSVRLIYIREHQCRHLLKGQSHEKVGELRV
jgi:hypothetical protein